MAETIDTGVLAEVPATDRLDVDGGDGSDATAGSDDVEAAAWAFTHPDGAPE